MTGVDLGGGGDDELRADINVTPLVDVMLVLLVIFMVVTPLLQLQLPVELPVAQKSEEVSARDQVVLHADADGALRLNANPVVRDGLEGALRDLYAARGDKTIFLEADRSLSYAAVVELLDTCRSAGVERIGVLTRRPAPS